MSSPPDALAGALLGLALGDALGFVVEAEPAGVARRYVSEVLRRGRAGEWHRPGYAFGQYSDDTQLARELLCSIAERGAWAPEDFARRIALLVRGGRDVGAGAGTRATALRLLLGAPWAHAGRPAPYAGNGSAMRVGPVGALGGWTVEERLRCAAEQSRVTHHDADCAAGAIAVAGAVVLVAGAGPIDPRGSLERIAGWCHSASPAAAVLVREVADWLALDPPAALERLRGSGAAGDDSRPWQGISNRVLPSVAWSLYAAFRSPGDWWETVCTAIEAGGDTDTTAAMAGAIAGARVGPAGLPAPLLEQLTDRGTWGAGALLELTRRCAALDSDRPGVILAQQGHP